MSGTCGSGPLSVTNLPGLYRRPKRLSRSIRLLNIWSQTTPTTWRCLRFVIAGFRQRLVSLKSPYLLPRLPGCGYGRWPAGVCIRPNDSRSISGCLNNWGATERTCPRRGGSTADPHKHSLSIAVKGDLARRESILLFRPVNVLSGRMMLGEDNEVRWDI